MDAPDYERRFGGIARLYGAQALVRFQQSHVCVIGVGGVGSWAAETLARSAIGRITLIDLDNVCESNVNRQVQALGDEFGKPKVMAMAQRIQAINPACEVTMVEDFVTPENLDALLGGGFDFIIDAIDNARTKAALIAWCKRRKQPLIVSGGAGGRVMPTRVELVDLSQTFQDSLLARVRTLLRREYGYPKESRKKFGVECVFSGEPPRQPVAACESVAGAGELAGLNCAGYGSAMAVTATFGMVAAGRVLENIAKRAG